MQPKALVFDWDGTLVDMFGQTHEAFNRTLKAVGREPWNEATAHEHIGKPDSTFFPAYFGAQSEEAMGHYKQAHRDLSKAHDGRPPEVVPGAHELVASLRRHKPQVHFAIVSNKPGELVRNELKLLGWDDVFDTVLGGDEVEHNKPHPGAMKEALAGKSIRNNEVIYIGDSGTDRDFARNTGSKLMIVGSKVSQGVEPGEQLNSLHEIQQRLDKVLSPPTRRVEREGNN